MSSLDFSYYSLLKTIFARNLIVQFVYYRVPDDESLYFGKVSNDFAPPDRVFCTCSGDSEENFGELSRIYNSSVGRSFHIGKSQINDH